MNLHVELLIGRRVRDKNGKAVGRIEELQATWQGSRCLIEEYHLGPAAWLERFGISTKKLVGWPLSRKPFRVPWHQLDLTDPEHPRLRCAREELE
jgi:sporulation protein YlmC with PRC-barrel domain